MFPNPEHSITSIAKLLGVSPSTLYHHIPDLKELRAGAVPRQPARIGDPVIPGSVRYPRAQARDPGSMDITVLVVPDCPNEKAAIERLRQALNDVGLSDTDVTTHVVGDQTEAERSGFTGSPTILIDGRGPFSDPDHLPGLTCRVYRPPDGLAGAPSISQLRRALTAAVGTAG